MGIRIHKALGWGLADIKTVSGNIVDTRINKEARKDLYSFLSEKEKEFRKWIINPENKNEFAKWCAEINHSGEDTARYFFDFKLIMDRVQRNNNKVFVVGDDEEDIEQLVMVLLPIESSDHYRFDDLIDYYENDGCAEESKVKDLTKCSGIFPYVGSVYCKFTLPQLKRKLKALGIGDKDFPYHFSGNTEDALLKSLLVINGEDYNQMVGRWDKKQEPTASGKFLEFLLKYYRPAICPSVIAFAKYSGVFSSPSKILDLKPMIYTYWS